ncbi:MAG TPA: carboxymuconolactone decarboxylase family protein, partial [Mycobacterium sp.]|nr:carboxymuconolactone decarboxylase family protein [Mycobacterium sp.]
MVDEGVPARLAGLIALSSGDSGLDTVIRLTCGRALSLPPLPSEVDLTDERTDRDAVVAAFAEQFVTDVSAIGLHQRKQLLSILGDNAFRVTVAIFIADFVPRVWAGLATLGMGKPGNGATPDWDHDTDPIDALLNGFAPAVARLRALDPVTTEVVRLRGAAQHNCRLCKSRREETALDAGGPESLYAE